MPIGRSVSSDATSSSAHGPAGARNGRQPSSWAFVACGIGRPQGCARTHACPRARIEAESAPLQASQKASTSSRALPKRYFGFLDKAIAITRSTSRGSSLATLLGRAGDLYTMSNMICM